MCRYCLRDICPPGCPNYSPIVSNMHCDICGENICDGDEYIENDNGDTRHLDCIFETKELLQWLDYEIKTFRKY